jgi:hypothetical protein
LLSARSLTWCAVISIMAPLVLMPGVAGARAYGADSGADVSAPEPATVDKPEKPGGLTLEQKRTYARLLAKYWLPTLLLLVIFVVMLMVVTRALKRWLLDRDRPVKFDPIEDVWSQAENKSDKRKKKGR